MNGGEQMIQRNLLNNTNIFSIDSTKLTASTGTPQKFASPRAAACASLEGSPATVITCTGSVIFRTFSSISLSVPLLNCSQTIRVGCSLINCLAVYNAPTLSLSEENFRT